jgi:hypothetical protein
MAFCESLNPSGNERLLRSLRFSLDLLPAFYCPIFYQNLMLY